MKPKIGFIGQGWIGKNYADDFDRRGYNVVRYSLDPQYINNKSKIADCNIVFIAVPTPTTPKGFEYSLVESVIKLVGKGKVAVIKSTLVPGTTEKIQKRNPNIVVLHAPEFLVESTAAHDAANPGRNIIGVVEKSEKTLAAAQQVLDVLPKSPFTQICSSFEAEFIKYIHNIHGYMQVVFSNILYDVTTHTGSDWEEIKKACLADPMMSDYYLNPMHKSGRGAGGDCFIKDFKAFTDYFEKTIGDKDVVDIFRAFEKKNIDLLKMTGKDLGILKGVYGDSVVSNKTKMRKKKKLW